jgi:predicted dinucleotide-utilizing enzyme
MSKKINNNAVAGNAITVPQPKEKTSIGVVGDGAMGATVVSKNDAPVTNPVAIKTKSEKTVAIHSSRNVSWMGVGEVVRGYNIVSEAAAEKWLTRNHTRIATPEEVAGAYKN